MAYCYFAADCLPCFKCLVIFLWKKQPNTEKSEEAHAEGEAGHEESEKEEGSLNLTSKQLVEYGVKLEQVGRGEVEQNLSYPAKLVVNTDQQAHVSSTFSARVDSVNVALGQQVEKGQALATLFVPDLVDQQANLSMAQEALTLAQQDYQREKQLWEQGVSARQDYQRAYNAYRQAQIQVQAANSRLSALGANRSSKGRYVLTAPLSGVISSKDIVIGEQIGPEKQLFVIDRLDQLWVEFVLPSANTNIQPNQEIEFKSLQTNNIFKAQVQSLTSEADTQTGRLQVRAKVLTPSKELRPNLMVNVLLKQNNAATVLRVNKTAIQQIDGKNVVFVAKQEKDKIHFAPVAVELGNYSSDAQWVEVKSGITEKQQYVTQGSFLLKSELEKGRLSMDINKPDLPKAEGLFDRIIQFSINNAIWVMMFVIAWIGVGIYSYQKLSIDAVPDITNVQVQINSQANGFTAPEVEQRITYPIENAMSGIPNLEQTRSISRYGLSQVTIIFKDGTDIYWARQLINQRLQEAKSALPDSIDPQMSPISTGLGEIYQWVVKAEPNAKKADGSAYSAMDLREIQDWIIRPQLQRVQGVAEVNSIGGYNKTYVVSPDLTRLQQLQIPLTDLQDALQNNNENRGAGFIEENGQQLTVRVPGMLMSIQDIQNVTVATKNGLPIRVADVASVSIGHDLRTGGATYNGQETVLGIAMMMMGENSKTIAKAIDDKVQEIQRSLPQGVVIETVYDRSSLVNKAIKTVAKNLIEGAILVIVILFIF